MGIGVWEYGEYGESETNMSSEKKPGWLGSIGDYTTQLYGDYI